MNKHKSNKIKENSNTVRHLIMGQIITTQNLVAIKEVRHAGQLLPFMNMRYDTKYFASKYTCLMVVEIYHQLDKIAPFRKGHILKVVL